MLEQTIVESKDAILQGIDAENDIEALVYIGKVVSFLELASGFFAENDYSYKAVEIADRCLQRLQRSDFRPFDLTLLTDKLYHLKDQYYEAHHSSKSPGNL